MDTNMPSLVSVMVGAIARKIAYYHRLLDPASFREAMRDVVAYADELAGPEPEPEPEAAARPGPDPDTIRAVLVGLIRLFKAHLGDHQDFRQHAQLDEFLARIDPDDTLGT